MTRSLDTNTHQRKGTNSGHPRHQCFISLLAASGSSLNYRATEWSKHLDVQKRVLNL
jgi:hypothetical protein